MSSDEKLNYITDIAVSLWHIHPFRDCNTRTLIAFIWQYCTTNSLSFNKDLLRRNLKYFRNSLVAATFEDKELGIKPDKSYLSRIMKDAYKKNYW